MVKKILVLSFIIFLSGFLYLENGFTASDPECIQPATYPPGPIPTCWCLSCVGSPMVCTPYLANEVYGCTSPNRRSTCSRNYNNFSHASINTLQTNITHASVTATCNADVCCCDVCAAWDLDGNCISYDLKKYASPHSTTVTTNYQVSNLPFETNVSPHCTSDRLPSRNPTTCQYNSVSYPVGDCLLWEWVCPC